MAATKSSHLRIVKFSSHRCLRRAVCRYTALVLLASMFTLSVPTPALAAVMREGLKSTTNLSTRVGSGFARWFKSLSRSQQREAPTAPMTDRGTTPRLAPSKEESEARIASIQINPSGALVLQSRQPMLFAAIPTDSGGTAIHGLRAEWESSDKQVVFISKGGQAIAGRPGNVTLTAKVGEASGACRLP